MSEPIWEIPSLKRISNSADWKGGRAFVLYNLDPDARTNIGRIVWALDAGNATDVHPDGGIELQGAAPCGRFGVAEHDADLFSDLVDENSAGVATG